MFWELQGALWTDESLDMTMELSSAHRTALDRSGFEYLNSTDPDPGNRVAVACESSDDQT
jgi:hypothetical protein